MKKKYHLSEIVKNENVLEVIDEVANKIEKHKDSLIKQFTLHEQLHAKISCGCYVLKSDRDVVRSEHNNLANTANKERNRHNATIDIFHSAVIAFSIILGKKPSTYKGQISTISKKISNVYEATLACKEIWKKIISISGETANILRSLAGQQ